jgi:hypothetical protein
MSAFAGARNRHLAVRRTKSSGTVIFGQHVSSVSGMMAKEPFSKSVDVAAVITDTLRLNEAAFAAPKFLFLSYYGEKYRREAGKSNR